MRDLWHNKERMVYAVHLRADEIFSMMVLVVISGVLMPHALTEYLLMCTRDGDDIMTLRCIIY